MSLTDIVKKLYSKYKSDVKYNTSLILSEIAAPFGAAGIAYMGDTINLNHYVSSIGGGITGNYVSAVATFVAAWYFLNKKVYKNNIGKFAKEMSEIILKNLPPAAVSYIVYSPIAAGFTYLGSEPEKSAFYASILSSAIFIAGSNIINQRIISKYRNKS